MLQEMKKQGEPQNHQEILNGHLAASSGNWDQSIQIPGRVKPPPSQNMDPLPFIPLLVGGKRTPGIKDGTSTPDIL